MRSATINAVPKYSDINHDREWFRLSEFNILIFRSCQLFPIYCILSIFQTWNIRCLLWDGEIVTKFSFSGSFPKWFVTVKLLDGLYLSIFPDLFLLIFHQNVLSTARNTITSSNFNSLDMSLCCIRKSFATTLEHRNLALLHPNDFLINADLIDCKCLDLSVSLSSWSKWRYIVVFFLQVDSSKTISTSRTSMNSKPLFSFVEKILLLYKDTLLGTMVIKSTHIFFILGPVQVSQEQVLTFLLVKFTSFDSWILSSIFLWILFLLGDSTSSRSIVWICVSFLLRNWF